MPVNVWNVDGHTACKTEGDDDVEDQWKDEELREALHIAIGQDQESKEAVSVDAASALQPSATRSAPVNATCVTTCTVRRLWTHLLMKDGKGRRVVLPDKSRRPRTRRAKKKQAWCAAGQASSAWACKAAWRPLPPRTIAIAAAFAIAALTLQQDDVDVS